MDKAVNKFLHGIDKLTEFNFDATFDAFARGGFLDDVLGLEDVLEDTF